MFQNLIVIDAYYISFNTFLIEPVEHEGKLYSHVYDKSGEYIVERKPFYIVRHSCNVLGSNYNNAKKIAQCFLGSEKHKLPIVVTQDFGIPNVFFPLHSPNSPSNIWVGLHAITNIRRLKEYTEITLKNGIELVVPLNYASFCSQYVSATMLQKHVAHQRTTIRNELNQPFDTE
ncbi:competence protein ComK [Lysinibacillus fusiformis]|nr:competence protein ComK [Lysinibacillus fusiformis]